MKIIIKSITPDYNSSALNYMLVRLAKFQLENFPSTNEFDQLVKNNQTKVFPLAQKHEFPQLSDKIAAKIRLSTICAENSLERDYPLLPDEKVIDNFYSYLLDDFQGVPKGCAVLRQKTNFAEIYFFFEDTAIVDGKIEVVPYPTSETHPRMSKVSKASASTFAQQLAEGLLGGIGGEIGSLICNTIFKMLGYNYVEPITADMLKNIVHQELTIVEIDKINGVINGTTQWIKDIYTPLKDSYNQNQSLTLLKRMNDELNSYADRMCTEAIATLEQPSFVEAGFPVYLIGVGIYISLYQELALIDTNGPESPYIEIVKNLAGSKFEIAQKNYNDIQAKRKGLYKKVNDRVCTPGGPNYAGQCYYRFEWTDSYSKANGRYDYGNKGQDDEKTAEAKCDAAEQKSITEALNILDSDLGNANSVLASWKKLIDQPLPIKA